MDKVRLRSCDIFLFELQARFLICLAKKYDVVSACDELNQQID